jgi:hypothetical protein
MINPTWVSSKIFYFPLDFLNSAFCCSSTNKNLYLLHEFNIVHHFIKFILSFIITSVKSVFTRLNLIVYEYYFRIVMLYENLKFVDCMRSTHQLLWHLAIIRISTINFLKQDALDNIALHFTHASLFSCCELTDLLHFYFLERMILKDRDIVVYFSFNFQINDL